METRDEASRRRLCDLLAEHFHATGLSDDMLVGADVLETLRTVDAGLMAGLREGQKFRWDVLVDALAELPRHVSYVRHMYLTSKQGARLFPLRVSVVGGPTKGRHYHHMLRGLVPASDLAASNDRLRGRVSHLSAQRGVNAATSPEADAASVARNADAYELYGDVADDAASETNPAGAPSDADVETNGLIPAVALSPDIEFGKQLSEALYVAATKLHSAQDVLVANSSIIANAFEKELERRHTIVVSTEWLTDELPQLALSTQRMRKLRDIHVQHEAAATLNQSMHATLRRAWDDIDKAVETGVRPTEAEIQAAHNALAFIVAICDIPSDVVEIVRNMNVGELIGVPAIVAREDPPVYNPAHDWGAAQSEEQDTEYGPASERRRKRRAARAIEEHKRVKRPCVE